MTTIDLRQHFIPQKAQIFCVYPGRLRKFLKTFEESERVFLEVPDLQLRPEVVGDAAELRRRLRRSIAIEEDIEKGVAPSLRNFPLSNFDGKPDSQDRSLNRLFGNVRALYADAQPGDLIISPGQGVHRTILFGELLAPLDPQSRMPLEKFGGLSVPTRPVRWIHKETGERPLPSHLSRWLIQRSAVTRIPVTAQTEEFYDVAYRNYVTTRNSRFDIFSPRYRVDNFFELNAVNQVMAVLLAAHLAVSSGADIRNVPPAALMSSYLDQEQLIYVRQFFASPGSTSVKSKSRTAAPVIAAMFALLLTSDVKTLKEVASGSEPVQITNSEKRPTAEGSKGANDAFCETISESVKLLAEGLGIERCKELQKELLKPAKDLGTEVSAVVR